LLSLDEDITNLNAISFSLDGSRLAAGGQGSLIHIWDADTGERLSDISTDRGSILELFFTPDGSSIRTLAQGGLVTTWDVASGVFLGSIPVACPLDSQIDAEVTADGQITVVACDRIALLRTDDTLENEGVHYSLEDDIIGASGVAINPEGTILAASSSTGVIKLLDLETEEERFTLAGQELLTKGEELRADTRGGLPFYHQAFGYLYPTRASFARALTGIDFSSDGRFLVAAGSDGTVSVYLISIEELMEAGRSR
ncbi:unnamed protein product, partial [marine sediment metagenome]